MRKKIGFVGSGLIIIALGTFLVLRDQPAAPEKAPSASAQTSQQTGSPEPAFDRSQHSLSAPNSPWVVVNKLRPLPSSYTPADLTTPRVSLRGGSEMMLRKDAARALEKMVSTARRDDVKLMLVSGYRSYTYQQVVYGSFVRADGTAKANKYSAKPGYSEHQTGLAVDVGNRDGSCQLVECFATTAGGKWVAQNAADYGFVIRYKKDWENIVGYSFEPWHLRYVGVELARELNRTNQPMESFFKLPPAPDYQ